MEVAAEAGALKAMEADPQWSWSPLREFLSGGATLSAEDLGLAGRALGLAQWHASARFCGTCGAATRAIEAGAKRACTQASCGARLYPRTEPVAIVAVESHDGRKILLGAQILPHASHASHHLRRQNTAAAYPLPLTACTVPPPASAGAAGAQPAGL